jgi:hypothetical protein
VIGFGNNRLRSQAASCRLPELTASPQVPPGCGCSPLYSSMIATYAFCHTLTGGRKRANHESSGTTCIQAAKRVCVDAVCRRYSLRQVRAQTRRRGRGRRLCDLVPGLVYARQPAQSRLGPPPLFSFVASPKSKLSNQNREASAECAMRLCGHTTPHVMVQPRHQVSVNWAHHLRKREPAESLLPVALAPHNAARKPVGRNHMRTS